MAFTVCDPATGPATCSFSVTLAEAMPIGKVSARVVLGAGVPLNVAPKMLRFARLDVSVNEPLALAVHDELITPAESGPRSARRPEVSRLCTDAVVVLPLTAAA